MSASPFRDEMLAARAEVLRQHPEVALAYELPPLLPEHLRQPYWEWRLDNAYRKKQETGHA